MANSGTQYLIAGLLLLTGVCRAADAPAAASPEDVKLVQTFLKTPTAQLPPEAIDHFLSIDPASLPKKLQKPFEGKKIELYTLQQLASGKKKGIIRTPDKDCAAPRDTQSQEIDVLRMAHYIDLKEEQEACIQEKSKCTERDMMCEFTLQVLVTPQDKKKHTRHLLVYESDPLLTYLVTCDPNAKVGGQTNFFGMGGPICSH